MVEDDQARSRCRVALSRIPRKKMPLRKSRAPEEPAKRSSDTPARKKISHVKPDEPPPRRDFCSASGIRIPNCETCMDLAIFRARSRTHTQHQRQPRQQPHRTSSSRSFRHHRLSAGSLCPPCHAKSPTPFTTASAGSYPQHLPRSEPPTTLSFHPSKESTLTKPVPRTLPTIAPAAWEGATA